MIAGEFLAQAGEEIVTLREAIAFVLGAAGSLFGGRQLLARGGHLRLEGGELLLPALLVLRQGPLASGQLLALLAHALQAGLQQRQRRASVLALGCQVVATLDELLETGAGIGDGGLELSHASLLGGGELFHRLARRLEAIEVGAGGREFVSARRQRRLVLRQLGLGMLHLAPHDFATRGEGGEFGAQRLVLLVEQAVALPSHGLLATQRLGGVAQLGPFRRDGIEGGALRGLRLSVAVLLFLEAMGVGALGVDAGGQLLHDDLGAVERLLAPLPLVTEPDALQLLEVLREEEVLLGALGLAPEGLRPRHEFTDDVVDALQVALRLLDAP